jgi:hypothetical protein
VFGRDCKGSRGLHEHDRSRERISRAEAPRIVMTADDDELRIVLEEAASA